MSELGAEGRVRASPTSLAKLQASGAAWRTCNGAADARPSSFHPRALSFLSPRLLSSAAAVRRREQRSLQLACVRQPGAVAAARPRPGSAAPLCGPPPARPGRRVAASCPRGPRYGNDAGPDTRYAHKTPARARCGSRASRGHRDSDGPHQASTAVERRPRRGRGRGALIWGSGCADRGRTADPCRTPRTWSQPRSRPL